MMDAASGSAQSAQNLTIATTTASSSSTALTSSIAASTTTAAITTVSGVVTTTSSSTVALLATGGSNISSSAAVSALGPKQQQTLQLDTLKQDLEANNSSLASAFSEGQRSLSGAPSASSSPILSPPGKFFGRNANGTMIATSRPSNEAEIQLYRVLQRASLLAYYDTLLEMGGDDVQQLYEAGEEEFLEIMALVGMASKPLHVRRLQKVLHEWANNPAMFQGAMIPGGAGFCETTPTKPVAIFNPDPSRTKFTSIAHSFNPTPLMSTAAQTSTSTSIPLHSSLPPQLPTPNTPIPSLIQQQTTLALSTANLAAAAAATASITPSSIQISSGGGSVGGATTHQVTSSSPQLTPVLTEMQVARITLGAEKIARQLPQREPRAQTSKKRTSRELEQVIAMGENDPRRMDEIRKYSAIYGRFDCKRRPEKPLTLHEVCVNEAAAQLCRLVPALLTRRDELFPLARQIVKDAGFGHSASIARYGGLLPQIQAQQNLQRSGGVVVIDCESSDSSVTTPKRQRLSSTETATASDLNRENLEDPRYNLFAMYQKFAKPPFDLSEITKFSLCKSDFEDNDNDSRFSFSNSSSPSMPQNNGSEHERELNESGVIVTSVTTDAGVKSPRSQHPPIQLALQTTNVSQSMSPHRLAPAVHHMDSCIPVDASPLSTSAALGGVQVISAAGGHIIAVANPALALSPTLNEALSIKREVDSPGM